MYLRGKSEARGYGSDLRYMYLCRGNIFTNSQSRQYCSVASLYVYIPICIILILDNEGTVLDHFL